MRKLLLFTMIVLLQVFPGLSFADPYYYSLEQTSSNLIADAVYTSSVYDVTTFETLNVNLESDQNSATNGLKINFVRVQGDCSSFTPTSSNMDYTGNGLGWTYTASDKRSYSVDVRGNCAWVTYTNGSTIQTNFNLTIFGTLK